jgi:SAM-dependent methyltransferase
MPIPPEYKAIVQEAQALVRGQLEEEAITIGHQDHAHFVAWESSKMQYQQFDQLLEMVEPTIERILVACQKVRFLDYGCGAADLLRYLDSQLEPDSFTYLGVDILEGMVQESQRQLQQRKPDMAEAQVQLIGAGPDFGAFADGEEWGQPFDVVIASGVFSLVVDHTDVLRFMQCFAGAPAVVLNVFAHGKQGPISARDDRYAIYTLYDPVLLLAYLQQSDLATTHTLQIKVYDHETDEVVGAHAARDGDTVVVYSGRLVRE